MYRFYVNPGQTYSRPLVYILNLLAQNKSLQIEWVTDKTLATHIFDHSNPSSIRVNARFYDLLLAGRKFGYEHYFSEGPRVCFEDNTTDYLATAFYMANSFQEFETGNNRDSFGRFRYQDSYQNKFNCIEENLVQKCFDSFCREILCLDTIKPAIASRVFISHDIDTIYGSFTQDGLWAIKRGRLDVLMKLVFNEIMRRPHWKNIDKIVNIHGEYDLKSTFFWLATQKMDSNGIKNADYDIYKIKSQTALTSCNGLHKSCYAYTFNQEREMLPFETTINRYHFLRFSLPGAWDDMENGGIKLDASLGFAERFGFRNSYGLPFKPYNLTTSGSYNIVEVPLNVMDVTLQRYMKIPIGQTASSIIDFFEKNRTNSVLSLLWHNTFFTQYKFGGYLAEYKKVLAYLCDSGIKSISPDEIMSQFK